MANRYLPFGYIITDGEICINEPESGLYLMPVSIHLSAISL